MENEDNKKLTERIHRDLLNLIDATLADEETGPRIQKLLDHFKISVDELKKEVLAYTLDKDDELYGNEQYREIAARLTLYFHNLVHGTYHHNRHNLVLSFLRKARPKRFIDIGYGSPGSYLFSYLQENTEAAVVLADQDRSAEIFAQQVFLNEAPKLLNRVHFLTYNMDSQKYPGDFDAYLYLDSVEHTKSPTNYLKKVVQRAQPRSHFIFSLPICEGADEIFHYYEWLNDEDAKKWVTDTGLKILDEGFAYPNPAVDFFAELIPGGYHNYLVLAQKLL